MNRRRSLLSVSKINVPDNYCAVNAYAAMLGSSGGGMFQDTILPEEFTIDFSALKDSCSIAKLFYTTKDYIQTPVVLNIIGDTSKISSYNLFLCRRSGIETINGTLDFSNCTTLDRPFLYCSALKNITIANGSNHTDFDISSTSVLTNESIQSIVDGLADITGSSALTVTFSSNQPISQAQADNISAKGWTLSGGLIS